MLIKARGVAGDPALAAEFLEMIQPFRYPRSMGDQASREVALMKQRIESEVVKAGEIDRNVKLAAAAFAKWSSSSRLCKFCTRAAFRFCRRPKRC